jgi:uncharacterized protein (DUF488 family)
MKKTGGHTMRLFTIGFTKKSARTFFKMLKESGAKRVIDVRLNNVSQLAGFAKKDDLAYFLGEICAMEYRHLPVLAPGKELLDEYKAKKPDWKTYETRLRALLRERHVEDVVSKKVIADSCLLCSEDKPQYCHRRVVADYLNDHWGDIEIIHLV